MKLAAVLVIYFPDIKELSYNIKSYIQEIDKLVIWQNTPVSQTSNIELLFKDLSETEKNKILIIGNGKNVGIATALNGGVEWALNNNYDHVLTLDQDSYFKSGLLVKYKELISTSNFTHVGVYGINPNNWGNLLYETNQTYLEVSDTITSGAIVPTWVFKKHGLFEDALFIDAVDYEFCYRIKTCGLKTIVFPAIILEHQVGEGKRTWLGFKTDNYSAFRTYFVVRNQIAIWKRYPDIFPKSYKIVLIKGHIIARSIKIVLAENNKLKKLFAIITGTIHGLQGKTGPINY
jgi:rhamnosyltransferase